jgi:CheY-like chemotaxis protein
VDDNPEQVDILIRLLSGRGMVALSAYSGQQCLEIVRRRRRRPIDVIVLDVVMPEMDGFEVCAALKKRRASRSIPIILLTARDDMKVRQQAAGLGVSELVIKPTGLRDLFTRIQTQVEVSRQARELERALSSKKFLKAKSIWWSNEKAIFELKEDFGIGCISTGEFVPNWADLEIKILAFNLLVLYQRQALGWQVVHRAKTLRRRVIAIAGQLIRTAGRWVLKLAEHCRWQVDLWRARLWLATLGP